MRAIWHMAIKDLRLLVRDKAGLFWLLAFPLIMALFFGSVMGGMGSGGGRGKLSLAFVDRTGGSQYAREFRESLNNSGALKVSDTTLPAARESVRLGKRQAYVALLPDSASGGFSLYPGGIPQFEVGIDPSRQAESALLQGLLTEAHFSLVMGQFQKPNSAKKMFRSSAQALDTLSDSASGMSESKRKNLSQLFGSLEKYYEKEEDISTAGNTEKRTQAAHFNVQSLKCMM